MGLIQVSWSNTGIEHFGPNYSPMSYDTKTDICSLPPDPSKPPAQSYFGDFYYGFEYPFVYATSSTAFIWYQG